MQPLNNGYVSKKSVFSRSTTGNVLKALPGKTPEQQTKMVRGLLQHLIDKSKSHILDRLKNVAEICPYILNSEIRSLVANTSKQNSPVVDEFRSFLNEHSSMVAANPATTAVSAPPPTITRVNPDHLKTGSGDSNDKAVDSPVYNNPNDDDSYDKAVDSPVYTNPNDDDSYDKAVDSPVYTNPNDDDS